MAKKTAKDIDTEVNISDARERIRKEIEKNFGKGFVVTGNDIISRPKTIIPFSPSLDLALNGGVPEGSWVVLAGKEKCGKSVSALHLAKKAQMAENGNKNIYFLNVEGRLKKRDIMGIPGIKADQIDIIESTEDKILSAKDYLNIAEKIIYTDKGCVLIIDSISSLCDDRELEEGVGTMTRGGGAMWVSQFTRQMSNVVPVKNTIVVSILHLMADSSGRSPGYIEKGGKAIQYQVDIKLRAEGGGVPWKTSETGPQIGQAVTWKCHSSALGPPGRKAESWIRYGYGIDEEYELVSLAKELGLISGSGWMTLDFMENHLDAIGIDKWEPENLTKLGLKIQGQEKVRKILQENPKWFEILNTEIQSALA